MNNKLKMQFNILHIIITSAKHQKLDSKLNKARIPLFFFERGCTSDNKILYDFKKNINFTYTELIKTGKVFVIDNQYHKNKEDIIVNFVTNKNLCVLDKHYTALKELIEKKFLITEKSIAITSKKDAYEYSNFKTKISYNNVNDDILDAITIDAGIEYTLTKKALEYYEVLKNLGYYDYVHTNYKDVTEEYKELYKTKDVSVYKESNIEIAYADKNIQCKYLKDLFIHDKTNNFYITPFFQKDFRINHHLNHSKQSERHLLKYRKDLSMQFTAYDIHASFLSFLILETKNRNHEEQKFYYELITKNNLYEYLISNINAYFSINIDYLTFFKQTFNTFLQDKRKYVKDNYVNQKNKLRYYIEKYFIEVLPNFYAIINHNKINNTKLFHQREQSLMNLICANLNCVYFCIHDCIYIDQKHETELKQILSNEKIYFKKKLV